MSHMTLTRISSPS